MAPTNTFVRQIKQCGADLNIKLQNLEGTFDDEGTFLKIIQKSTFTPMDGTPLSGKFGNRFGVIRAVNCCFLMVL